MTTGPVVGPGQSLPGVKPQTPLTPSTPQMPGDPGASAINAINNRLKNGKNPIKIKEDIVGSMSYIDALNSDQLVSIGKILKMQGYTIKANANFIKNLMTKDDPTLQAYVNSATNYNELVAALQQGTLAGLAKGTSDKTNYDTRSIRKVSDITINNIIDTVSQSSLRKNIEDPIERAALVKQIKAKFEEGTVTSTKKVKNPKTGKWEAVSTTSGPTSEDIQLDLAKQLEKTHASDLEVNQTLEFNSFLNKMNNRGA